VRLDLKYHIHPFSNPNRRWWIKQKDPQGCCVSERAIQMKWLVRRQSDLEIGLLVSAFRQWSADA
jgi:hypothetical protein